MMREARDDRLVVAEQPVAVELHELVRHDREELQDPRAAQVAGQLDAAPDDGLLVHRGLGLGRRALASAGASVAAAEDAVNHGPPPPAAGAR